MADTDHPVDLTTCDLEPIHIIGRIQSFGWLISFANDRIVNHVSENCSDLFGRSTSELVGTPITSFLSSGVIHDLRSRMQMLGTFDSVERIFGMDLLGDGRDFDVALHVSGKSYVLEIEPAEQGKRRDYAAYVRPMMDRMRKSRSIEAMCQAAARNLRGLTGFDRVMVYRFGPDGAGEVIAESLNGAVDSYEGLHFPASDIPSQARRLYSRNLLRIISDVNDPTVPVVPASGPDGTVLDMSMSTLRAVSPIHIEYLRNMGVQASMSVSIMRRGQLWGLMACHHYSPLYLNYSIRTAAELFGEFFSYLLEQKHNDHAVERRTEAAQLHDRIMARMAGGESLLDAFDDFSQAIREVIPFDGIAGWVEGTYIAEGSTPEKEQFEELARFLNTAGASSVWSTDNIASLFKPAEDYRDKVAGLLALPVSRSPRDYIVLFRKEHVHEVSWAGNPHKPVEVGELGARISPRKSFDLWKEERRGYSRPWHEDEIAIAESLRVTLLEVVLRLVDAASQQGREAAQRQDVLIAELNHRVRNILNLIRSLVSQSRDSSSTMGDFISLVGSRIEALARAHDQVTRTAWSPSSLYQLIRTECEAYAGGSGGRISISGPDAMIAPAAFTTLALVMHELVTNSCKHGALSAPAGTVDIRISRAEDDALSFTWTEHGGPEVSRPERRGFGSTIIERMIPHELNGVAEVEYRTKGLFAAFAVPVDYVASYDEPLDTPAATAESSGDGGDMLPELIIGTALVLEDNVLIAMEAEDMLARAGFASCKIAGSNARALEIIAEGAVTFALLDINLSGETSEPVAHELLARDIPFIFASGYGEIRFEGDGLANVPVLTKPYSGRDMLAALKAIRLPV
ncbi:MAG: GAF domain-containing protein [Novosphingobium sp.]|nr:GAF domain-containing protein [Novosphingobium sp.]